VTPKKPRFKDKETRIKEIQQAARKVLFKKEYFSTTLEEIAREAGIAKGTIYLYFANKEDLYISLMYPTILNLQKRLIKFDKELDFSNYKNGGEFIKSFFNLFYEWYQSDPEGFNICSAFQQGGLFSRMSSETLELLNKTGKIGFEAIRRIIRKAKDIGFVKKEANEYIINDFIYSAFLGVIQFEENKRRVSGKDYRFETASEAFSIIAYGICSINTR